MENGGPAEQPPEEDHAPEGGWGWIVALGMSVMFTVVVGPMGSFGLVFGEFLEDVGGGTQAFTLINSVFVTSLSFTGLVTNFTMKEFSCRQVAVTGCLIAFTGNILAIFATSVNYMVVTYGIVQGVGFGLMITPSFTAFNTYFIRRRNFAMGLSQIVIGLGCMGYPLLISALYNKYGFRGTQAVLTALGLHALPAMMTYQPVSWHMPARRGSPLLSAQDKVKTAAETTADLEKAVGNHDQEEAKKLLNQEQQSPAGHDEQVESGDKWRKSFVEERGRSYNTTPRTSVDSVPVSSVLVLGHRGSSAPPPRVDDKTYSRMTIAEKVVDFFDLKLMQDPVYVSIAMGLSAAMVADMSFFNVLPVYLAHLGVAQVDIAVCIAVGAACDLGGRVALALLGLVLVVDSRTLVLIGLVFTIIFRTVFIFYTDYIYLTIFTGFISIFRPFLLIELPLVFAEYCSLQRFPSAYGLFMITSGMFALTLGPIVGVIRDVTGSYPLCLHSLTILTLMCVIPWFLEMCIMRFKWRRSLSQRILNLK